MTTDLSLAEAEATVCELRLCFAQIFQGLCHILIGNPGLFKLVKRFTDGLEFSGTVFIRTVGHSFDQFSIDVDPAFFHAVEAATVVQ